MSVRVREVFDKKKFLGYMILCPACNEGHFLNIGFTFNENFQSPTFNEAIDIPAGELNHRCHCRIRAGWIIYEQDCSHPFAGKTLELPMLEMQK
jgi:hypothetical protein